MITSGFYSKKKKIAFYYEQALIKQYSVIEKIDEFLKVGKQFTSSSIRPVTKQEVLLVHVNKFMFKNYAIRRDILPCYQRRTLVSMRCSRLVRENAFKYISLFIDGNKRQNISTSTLQPPLFP